MAAAIKTKTGTEAIAKMQRATCANCAFFVPESKNSLNLEKYSLDMLLVIIAYAEFISKIIIYGQRKFHVILKILSHRHLVLRILCLRCALDLWNEQLRKSPNLINLSN